MIGNGQSVEILFGREQQNFDILVIITIRKDLDKISSVGVLSIGSNRKGICSSISYAGRKQNHLR